MPVNVPMLQAMQKKYGKKKGQSVYFASENKGKKGFAKGVRTASKQGLTVAHLKTLKTAKGKAVVKKAKAFERSKRG